MLKSAPSPAPGPSSLLAVEDLRTYFPQDGRIARAVDGVSLTLRPGRVLGLVGESGCGKSMTALSILRLVPPPGRIVGGRIVFRGRDLVRLPEHEMRTLRGAEIAMVFQEPMSSLNPVFTVGGQIAEAIRLHRSIGRRGARELAVEMLSRVEIPEPARVARSYPHELSGGMRQRVMIAMAVSCEPRLLIADEPTTALDVTIQAQILALLGGLRRRYGMALLLITHDLGVVAEEADEVAIMYAGKIVEHASVQEIFAAPLHPYTQGLLRSIPAVGGRRTRLEPIPGSVPDLSRLPAGCRFADRCPLAVAACREGDPPFEEKRPGHRAACIRV